MSQTEEGGLKISKLEGAEREQHRYKTFGSDVISLGSRNSIKTYMLFRLLFFPSERHGHPTLCIDMLWFVCLLENQPVLLFWSFSSFCSPGKTFHTLLYPPLEISCQRT